MSQFHDHGLDSKDFGVSKDSLIKTFDAFPKTRPSYVQSTRGGWAFTLAFLAGLIYLYTCEFRQWLTGTVSQSFAVEKDVSRAIQINVDIVVAMKCQYLNVNIKDISGDRLFAANMLKLDPTLWRFWQDDTLGQASRANHFYETLPDSDDLNAYDELDTSVDFALSHVSGGRRRKFTPTPPLPFDQAKHGGDACRIFGSLKSNKVKGNFHITARGHGYVDLESLFVHIDHENFNFSHHINELSFGPYYPDLTNPLDGAQILTSAHFFKQQYALSLVPTIFTTLDPTSHPALMHTSFNRFDNPFETVVGYEDDRPPPESSISSPAHSVFTHQYSVAQESNAISSQDFPGIFIRYDIEPILILVSQQSPRHILLFLRLITIGSGLFVAISWISEMFDALTEYLASSSKLAKLPFLQRIHDDSLPLLDLTPRTSHRDEQHSPGLPIAKA